MTFLAPLFLAAGAAVAAAIVLLHFLARQRPRAAIFPTARFVPDRPARSPSRAPRPTDWPLLALRVLAVSAIAGAFAQPMRTPGRAVTTRIVLVDRSRSVADARAMRDSTVAVLREGDIAIAFDTTVRALSRNSRDTLGSLEPTLAPASLSLALLAAERAARDIREHADSIELIIVSPFASESWDEATWAMRSRWQGRARLISVPLARGDTGSRGIDVRAPASDAVRAAAAPFASGAEGRSRVVRTTPNATDSLWTRERGHVLVAWPSAADSATSGAQAVVGSGVVLAAPLVRRVLDSSSRGRVIARFGDGTAAIVEHSHGRGCIRDVGFDLPAAGDVALRESARRLMGILGAPCENDEPRDRLPAATLDSLRGSGPLLASSAVPRAPRKRSAATSWLLIIGALLLLAEVGVRQRTRSA